MKSTTGDDAPGDEEGIVVVGKDGEVGWSKSLPPSRTVWEVWKVWPWGGADA